MSPSPRWDLPGCRSFPLSFDRTPVFYLPSPGGSVQKGGPQPPFGLVVLRGDCQEGEIEIPLLTVSFGYFSPRGEKYQRPPVHMNEEETDFRGPQAALTMTGRKAQARCSIGRGDEDIAPYAQRPNPASFCKIPAV